MKKKAAYCNWLPFFIIIKTIAYEKVIKFCFCVFICYHFIM